MKIGNSLQFLQIWCVQLPGLSPKGGGSLGPAPFLPKSSSGSCKKQENRMGKRDRDPRSGKETPDRGKSDSHRATKFWQMGTRRLLWMSRARLGAFHTNSLKAEFPFMAQVPLPALPGSPKLLLPQHLSCPIPHSPRTPQAVPNSGERQLEQLEHLHGKQSSSGIQKGNNPRQRFCYSPKISPEEQGSGTGEPPRCERVPDVTWDPKPAPLTPRGFQPLNPCTPQMLFPSIPTGKGRNWPHTVTDAPGFVMDF